MKGWLRPFVSSLTVAVLAVPALPPAMAETPAPGALEGKVLETGGVPVQGAVVLVRSVEDATERSSQPTGDDGSYRLADLPAGHYDVAVKTSKGLYLGARSLQVSGMAAQGFSFRLENRSKDQMRSYAESKADAKAQGDEGKEKQGDDKAQGDKGKEKKKHKKGGVVPPLGWNNPLAVVAAGLAFVIGTGALIESTNNDHSKDHAASPSGP